MISIRDAIRAGIAEEMHKDSSIIILGEEIGRYNGAYKVTKGMLDEFGSDRVLDTPITEHGFTGMAIGAAFTGLRPIVEFMTFNFSMQAIDQIVNSAAKTLYMSGGQLRCPIVFRGPNGAAARVGAQHSQNYASWYSNVPGLKVIAPYTANDFKGLIKSAIQDNNPVIFLENELLYGEEGEIIDTYIPIGKANILQSGTDVTLISYSLQLRDCLAAANIVKQHNISCEIIDLRTIKPLDIHTIITSVKKTNRVVIVDESWPFASVSSEIACQIMELAFDYLDAPIKRVTAKDIPLPYAANLEKAALPSKEEVVQAIYEVCYKKP